jgi:hypothetical protein
MRSFSLIVILMVMALGCKEGASERSTSSSKYSPPQKNSGDAIGKQAVDANGTESEQETQFENVLTDDDFDGDQEEADRRKKNENRGKPDLDLKGDDDLNDSDDKDPKENDGQDLADNNPMQKKLSKKPAKKFKRGMRKNGKKFAEKMLKQFDDDGDEKIDQGELSKMLVFIKSVVFGGFFDMMKPGKKGPGHGPGDGFGPVHGPGGQGPHPKGPPPFDKLLACLDDDGDKKLSEEEWALLKDRRDCMHKQDDQADQDKTDDQGNQDAVDGQDHGDGDLDEGGKDSK